MSDYTFLLLRTTLAFVVLYIFSRILGKKLISQMTFFDFVAAITMGTTAASLGHDLKTATGLLFLSLSLWFAFSFFLDYISLKSRSARKILEGEPILVIQNGKILEDNMSKERFNLDELLLKLREKNIYNISDVEFAFLETDGMITVLPKSQKRPLTPADLKIPTTYEGVGTELIMDGQILYANLEHVKLDLQWLKDQLTSRNISSVDQVILAYLATNGKLYTDVKTDDLTNYNNPAD